MQILLTGLLLFISVAQAADPNKPHPHNGISTKFTTPQKATLSATEAQQLSSGKPVFKQVQAGNGGRGIAIFDVQANEQTVWSVISSLEKYPSWIDEIAKCDIYKKEGNDIYADFVISTWGVEVQYYIKHNYAPTKGYLTWELDYSRESDLDDSTGYWLVYPSPIDPSKTRVEYSVDLRIKGWVPSFIQTMLAESGVEDATKWVKREAEKRAK